jgi:hypothetical protein|tara:strand:+ start:50 stop:214 length:165 start_codon:yes stop_codon:yes gene_type:complete
MTKKTTTIGSDTWEWDETPEVKAAIAKLHRNATERLHADIRKLELKAPDYGVGK